MHCTAKLYIVEALSRLIPYCCSILLIKAWASSRELWESTIPAPTVLIKIIKDAKHWDEWWFAPWRTEWFTPPQLWVLSQQNGTELSAHVPSAGFVLEPATDPNPRKTTPLCQKQTQLALERQTPNTEPWTLSIFMECYSWNLILIRSVTLFSFWYRSFVFILQLVMNSKCPQFYKCMALPKLFWRQLSGIPQVSSMAIWIYLFKSSLPRPFSYTIISLLALSFPVKSIHMHIVTEKD